MAEIRADYQQGMLFPPTLEEMVPKDHPARLIRDFVDQLDLVAIGFREREAEVGRPNYAADLMVRIWLYGYMSGIRSTRKLERACHDMLPMIWLAGRHTPDHKTLWQFQRDNRKPIKLLSRHIVRVAAKAGLVGLVLHAVDGTKIETVSATSTGHHRKALEKALKNLDRSVSRYYDDADRSEQQESGEYRLPEELQETEDRKRAIEKILDELRAEDRESQHPVEPEAKMVKLAQGPIRFGYNAQVVTDEQSGLIVAQEVVTDQSDNAQLVPMIEIVQETLGSVAAETLADGGYASSAQLAAAEQAGFQVTVPLPHQCLTDSPYHARHFTYEPESNTVTCPRGHQLPQVSTKQDRGETLKVFRCRAYKSCAARAECSRGRAPRAIEIGPHREALLNQIKKQASGEVKARMRQRSAIAETPFAGIKERFGFRRWTMRGLDAARTQWDLVCSAYNLAKLIPAWRAGKLVLEG